jgi:probable F420-dependent oxidoreductase
MLELKATMQPWELQVTGADQIKMTKRADALGYDMVSISEHFVIPSEHVDLSGARYFDATTAQAVLAGATERMRVNSCVTILPLHDPIVLAKRLATIDWLSSGRLTVTFGVGWLEKEFELLGVPFRERGRMSDEYLEAMIALWTQERPSFQGRYVNFSDVAFEPKPVQNPHPEIWIGGDADGALRRAARFASGWHPFLTKAQEIPARLEFIKSQPTYDGRPLEVMYGMSTERVGEGHVVQQAPRAAAGQSKQRIIDRLNEFAELGVTVSAVPIPPCRDSEEYMDYAQWVIEEIKPAVG